MDPSKLTTTTQIIGLLSMAFTGRQMAQEQMDLYLWRLAGIESDLLRAAVVHLIDTWTYSTPPSIGTIRETAQSLDTRLNAPTPLEAWGLARAKKHRDGPWGEVIDKAMQQAVGWHALENASAMDLSWHRRAFTERYEELLVKDQVAPDVRRMLEGYQQRLERALPDPKPKAIPDRIPPTQEDPTPAKPLGFLMADYKAELAKVNPEGLARLNAKEKHRA